MCKYKYSILADAEKWQKAKALYQEENDKKNAEALRLSKEEAEGVLEKYKEEAAGKLQQQSGEAAEWKSKHTAASNELAGHMGIAQGVVQATNEARAVEAEAYTRRLEQDRQRLEQDRQHRVERSEDRNELMRRVPNTHPAVAPAPPADGMLELGPPPVVAVSPADTAAATAANRAAADAAAAATEARRIARTVWRQLVPPGR